MTTFKVRQATAVDFAFIQDLVSQARQASEPWASSWTSAMVTDELNQATVLVAETSAVIAGQTPLAALAGFVCVRPPGSGWEITLIATDACFRGKGVAGVLIGAISDLINAGKRDAATSAILLEVREDNRAAIQAYEKSGFKAIGRRPGYYRDGAAAILYKKG